MSAELVAFGIFLAGTLALGWLFETLSRLRRRR